MSYITVDKINKSFHVNEKGRSFFNFKYIEKKALKNISFEILRGECVGYIGPNGSGKSTTIKILCGILKPDSGECFVNGRCPWKDRINHVSKIGAVFGQKSQLWWDLPAIDTFKILKKIYKMSDKEYRENFNELDHILDLGSFITTPVRQLSLGQRMRCEVACSLIHNPEVLFLDEPTIGLDTLSKIAVRKFIKNLNKQYGTTIVLTTHDLGDVENICKRIIVLSKGNIIADEKLETIREKFKTNKKITIEFSKIIKPFHELSLEIIESSENKVIYSFPPERTDLKELIQKIIDHYLVIDLKIEDADIEEIISKIYVGHNL